MAIYKEMSREELEKEFKAVKAEYEQDRAKALSLDM